MGWEISSLHLQSVDAQIHHVYFEEVVKKHNEYDLPKEFREQEDLESDESESEESDWIL